MPPTELREILAWLVERVPDDWFDDQPSVRVDREEILVVGPLRVTATGHEADGPELCYALSEIQGGEFVPEFTTEGKPFICFENGAPSLPDEPDHQD